LAPGWKKVGLWYYLVWLLIWFVEKYAPFSNKYPLQRDIFCSNEASLYGRYMCGLAGLAGLAGFWLKLVLL
jgi:hypothetical protein